MERFFTSLIATHAGMITSVSSTPPSGETSTYYGTLPYRSLEPRSEKARSFGSKLESRSFSAQNYLTSEQLRTL